MRHIVLTGGPHGGKSTILEKIDFGHTKAKKVQEVATTLYQEGIHPNLGRVNIDEFQKLIIQRHIEIYNNLKIEDYDIVIRDRRITDGKAYIPFEMYLEFLEEIGHTEQSIEEIPSHIIHLTSTAKDLGFYNKGEGARSWTTKEQAVQLDNIILDVYKGTNHKRTIIHNHMNGLNISLEEKLLIVKNTINSVCKN